MAETTNVESGVVDRAATPTGQRSPAGEPHILCTDLVRIFTADGRVASRQREQLHTQQHQRHAPAQFERK